jgi:hypothetical protein
MENAKLTLYFIPSPFGLDWSSPSSLARTIVLNKYSFKSRFMGHVNIELEFLDKDNNKSHLLTGMVAKKLDAVPLLLKEHMGLGILWHSFQGRLETKEELVPELTRYQKTGKRLNFITYNISHDVARNLNDYYELYKQHQIYNFYGLVNSPLHGEGAGCSGFGASFLSVAGLLDEDFIKNCSTSVKAPMRLIGPPITNNSPNFIKLLFKNESWASEDEAYKEIYFWDPDLMFNYTKKLIENADKGYQVVSKNKSPGIEYPLKATEVNEEIFFTEMKSQMPDLSLKTNIDLYNQVIGKN